MPSRKKTNEEFDADLIRVNPTIIRVDSYEGSEIKINFKCAHNHIWSTKPRTVLSGKGCPECYLKSKSSNNSTYDKKLKLELPGFKRIGEYINNRSKLRHICPKGHEFDSVPTYLFFKKVCPLCSFKGKGGLDYSSPTSLYFIKIEKLDKIYYKVGITNKNVKERFAKDRDKIITTLLYFDFSNGFEASNFEKFILNNSPIQKVHIKDFLKSKGNTELFEKDISEWILLKYNERILSRPGHNNTS